MNKSEKALIPDFIIIGAMKCATSTLHDQIKAHNSFFMTDIKEPNFFSNDEIYAKGIAWYGELFADALPGQLKGESSTHYTKLPTYPNTIKRLSSFCPDAKFIYVMRHPVDRLISHYIHEWTQRVISCQIDKAIERFPELIDYGCYVKQIEPYFSVFGASKILPVFAERIRDNPNRELRRIFDFLQVDEKPVWRSDIQSNISGERLRTSAWRDAIVSQSSLRYIRKNFIPKKIRNFVKSFWKMKKRPQLSRTALEKIEMHFDKDLKKLGEILDMELRCGNFKEQILSPSEINWK